MCDESESEFKMFKPIPVVVVLSLFKLFDMTLF